MIFPHFFIVLVSIDYCYGFVFSVVTNDSDESSSKNENATSTEILDSVLKQLHKLNSEKRRRILDILKDDDENTKKVKHPKVFKEKKAKGTSDEKSIEDEVEILDMNEPKMGTYKRKRSKNLPE